MYVLVSLYVHKITNKLQYGKMKSAKQPDFSVKHRNGNKLYLLQANHYLFPHTRQYSFISH